MSKIKCSSLTDNLQFSKFHPVRTCTMLLIGLLGIFIVSSCRSKKLPSIESSSEPTYENEEAKTLSMSVDKTYLGGREHAITLTIKVMEKEHFARLENFKLKVEFLEELTWGNNGNNNNISYKNAAKQQQIARNINKALSEFIDLPTIGADSSKKQIKIPINLKINKQATKLRLGIELLDKQEQALQKLEVVWRKGELLIGNLNELIGEKIGNFSLKNTTHTPIDPDKIELTLVNDNGIICQFLKTNASTATLKQLLKDGGQSLVPDTETESIEVQIINPSELKKIEKTRLVVTQNPEKVSLATHIINCKPSPKPTPSKTKASRQKASKDKKEEDKFEEKKQAIPTESSKSTVTEATKEEAKVAKEETQKEQSTSTSSAEVLNNKNPKQKGKSKRKIENKQESKSAIQQQTEPDSNAKKKEGKNKHTTTTALEWDTEQEKMQSQEEHISQSIDKKDLPIKEDPVTLVNPISPKLQNEKFQQEQPNSLRPKNDFTTSSAHKVEAQVGGQQVPQQQSEVNKEKKDKNLTSKPELHLNAEIKLKKNGQPTKIFNVSIENKGVKLSKEMLNSVKLKYEIKGEGDLTDVKLKRRRNQGGTIINGASIDNFLNSGLITGQKENFELIIETGDAKSLTIILFLEGAASANTATVYWKKEEKPKKKEKELALISTLEMNVEPRNDETSEVITVWLENKGDTLTKKALNNIKLKYTLAGTGEISNAKLKKRKKNLVDAQGAKLGNLLDGGLEANHKKKFKLTIEGAHADTLTIDLSLEGLESTSPVIATWRKIAAT